MQRAHTWTFMGDINKSTRPRMMAALQTVPNGFDRQVRGVGHGAFIPPWQMRQILRHAVFCPAPMGPAGNQEEVCGIRFSV